MVKQNMGQSKVIDDQTLKQRKPSEVGVRLWIIQGSAGNSMPRGFY